MPRWLLATDGSPASLRAAAYAASLAHTIPDVHITLLAVQEDAVRQLTAVSDPSFMGVSEALVKDLEEASAQKARWALEQTEVTFRTSGIAVERRAEQGSPRDRICKIAADGSYDLVVIGSRGLGEIEGLLLGSVSQYVAQHAACPVLLVR